MKGSGGLSKYGRNAQETGNYCFISFGVCGLGPARRSKYNRAPIPAI